MLLRLKMYRLQRLIRLVQDDIELLFAESFLKRRIQPQYQAPCLLSTFRSFHGIFASAV